jgi:hypothetical protein
MPGAGLELYTSSRGPVEAVLEAAMSYREL